MPHLFEKFGIEIEYMIVGSNDFAVRPIADDLIAGLCGAKQSTCPVGGCHLSNELAAHVVELKCPEPVSDLAALGAAFADAVQRVESALEPFDARLLPGPMHPVMDPARESKLWEHEGYEIYSLYDRIFGCRRHGWLNLQSCHLNLPFAGDDEFARLHAAIILLLPLMPALTAGSPFCEGSVTGLADTRLDIYRHNQERFPAITGPVIPEAVFSRQEYEETILAPMYREIAPVDPEGVLQFEWLNSRGAIARFDRDAIEIRLLDSQECPAADIALAAFVVEVLRRLADLPVERLRRLARRAAGGRGQAQLDAVIRRGADAPLHSTEVCEALGLSDSGGSAGEFWNNVFRELPPPDWARETVGFILRKGNLARRLNAERARQKWDGDFGLLMAALADSLRLGRPLDPSRTGSLKKAR